MLKRVEDERRRRNSDQEKTVFFDLSDHVIVIGIVVDAEDGAEDVGEEGAEGAADDGADGAEESVGPFGRVHFCQAPEGAGLFLEGELFEPVAWVGGVEGDAEVGSGEVGEPAGIG
ncbi:hypothetical protein U1Q18_008321 [Sarracenia purpurea var. burkii]